MKVIKSIVALLFCLCFCSIFSQSKIEFQQLKGDNVSTQSITYAIAKDSIGNVWIASEEGVLKHNSKFYKVYNTYSGLPEVFGNRVTALFISKLQNIYIGSENGIAVYNKDQDKFESIRSSIDIIPSLVTTIIEDNSEIWIGGFNGLWQYDYESKNLKREVANQNIQALSRYSKGLLFGTQRGLFFYDKSSKELKEINLAGNSNISHISQFEDDYLVGTKTGLIYKIDEDLRAELLYIEGFNVKSPITDIVPNDEILFIATDGNGLFKVGNKLKIIEHYLEDVNDSYSLSSNGIYDIDLDDQNTLWIATYGGGVDYLVTKKLPFIKVQHKVNSENSIVSDFTRSIAIDQNKNIWFGTKKGISIWNRSNNNWRHIPSLSNKNNSQDIVLALQSDEEYMWVGTYNDGLYKVNTKTLERTHFNAKYSSNLLKKIYTIYKDRSNNVWVGGIEKNLFVIDPNDSITSFPLQQIKFITQSKSGEILAAGRNGIYKIDFTTQEFSHIEELKPNKDNLAYSTINAVYETDNGSYYIATNGEGLLYFNPKNKELKKMTKEFGMPSDIAQGILSNKNNSLWVSSTKGLVNINFTENDTLINVYDKEDGLSSTEFNYGSFNQLENNLFAFGGVEGVTLFNPDLIKIDRSKPNLVFDQLKLSNKIIGPNEKPLDKHINQTSSLVLKHFDNSLELQFTGVLNNSSSKVKYSWILDGFEDQWTEPSTTNFATYTNLNPGEYTFKVKAYNKFGIAGAARQINIEILSPWWATNLAYLLYVLAFIALIYAIIHITSVIVKKKNADEQINFFNNITHEIKTPLAILISSLDNVTDNVKEAGDSKNRIKTTVKRINSLFEQMLNFHKVTSNDHLAQDVSEIDLKSHIEQILNDFKPLAKERNLKFQQDYNWPHAYFYFDLDVLDKIILNLLSNAIKYSKENGTITISVTESKTKRLNIEIKDEGIGIPQDQQKFILQRYYRARNVINSQRPGTGLGLIMVKKLIEKTNGSISFVSEENKGTTFSILLPNLKNTYKEKEKTRLNSLEKIHNELELVPELEEFSDSKILIVEDNDELRQLLVNSLGLHFQILEASNGKEGLEMAGQYFPDIILTDLIMPVMDGQQMCNLLKEDINLNHIPVFMLTVLQNSDQKIESLESGITEYIEKPINIKFLLAKMINTLKFQNKLREKYVHDSDALNATLFRNKNNQDFLIKLENTVIENINNDSFSIHDLSACFGMSRTSLYMKLKNLVDLSPQDFVIHTKLKYAKSLLIKSDSSIKEVAYQSGFSNPKYFSTSFKKFYGTTPSKYLSSLESDS